MAYVPVDFTVDNLADKLLGYGYSTTCPTTVFLWEGLAPYLDLGGGGWRFRLCVWPVRRAARSCSITYCARWWRGRGTPRGPAHQFAKMSRTSEPLTFGIDEGQAPAFLASRGFQNVVDARPEELTSRYFDPHGKHRYIKPWWRMICGEVGAAVGGLSEATHGPFLEGAHPATALNPQWDVTIGHCVTGFRS